MLNLKKKIYQFDQLRCSQLYLRTTEPHPSMLWRIGEGHGSVGFSYSYCAITEGWGNCHPSTESVLPTESSSENKGKNLKNRMYTGSDLKIV